MAGEFFYLSIYVLQQLGVMLGVGAQTVLLCTHLVAVHRGEQEVWNSSFARAARGALGTGFVLIILSGLAAVGLHVASGAGNVLVEPAFLFKWVLVLALLGAFFLHSKFFLHGNIFYGLVGGSWYALFLIHSLAPATTWFNILALYAVWMAAYALLWFVFVGIMQWHTVKKVSAPAPAPVLQKPAPLPPRNIVPTPLPAPKPLPPPPKVAPIVAKPIIAAVAAAPAPVVVKALPPQQPKPVQPLPVVAAKLPEPAKPSLLSRFLRWLRAKPAPVPAPMPMPKPAPLAPPKPTLMPEPVILKPLPASISAAPPAAPLVVKQPLSPLPQQLPTTPPVPVPTPPLAPVLTSKPLAPLAAEVPYVNNFTVPPLRVMPKRPEDIAHSTPRSVIN